MIVRLALLAVTLSAVPLSAAPVMGQIARDRIPAPGGEIVFGPSGRRVYEKWHFAAARRAGDYVYISGVVIARETDGPRTAETFKTATRAGFARIAALLAEFGLSFDDVVMVNSFHDWTASEFGGDRLAQFVAFGAVKDEYMRGVYPAWTAVGTSGLIDPNGIVEVQMIAYAPQRRRPRR